MASAEANLDAHLARLDESNQGKYRKEMVIDDWETDDQVDIKSKVVAATEIRDNLDVWCQSNGQIYSAFLEKSIPVLLKILDGQPVFDSASPTQVS
jgi:hypothetical protein